MMRSMFLLAAAVGCLSVAVPPSRAEATGGSWQGLSADYMSGLRKQRPRYVKRFRHKRHTAHRRHRGAIYSANVVGGRPAGCPARYCGCASARYVGLSGGQWNLAANWLRLPRAMPGPGMAAARRGHVKIITGSLGGGVYQFYDPNSGGGRTRITTGGLGSYTVVNPYGGISYASASKKWRRR